MIRLSNNLCIRKHLIDIPAKGVLQQPELALNGGFEIAGGGGADVFAEWVETVSDGAITADTTYIHSGAKSAKLTTGAGKDTLMKLDVTVEPLKTYRISFWTAGDGTREGRYAVLDKTHGNANLIALVSTGIKNAIMTPFSNTFSTPAGCVTITVVVRCSTTVGRNVYFDDVSIKLVS